MPVARHAGPSDPPTGHAQGPLHSLVFLAPLILLYEIGIARYLHASDELAPSTIKAYGILDRAFDLVGAGGLHLPAVLIVLTLLLWHAFLRQPWKIHWRVIGIMLGESIAWTVPVLILAFILAQLLGVSGSGAPAAAGIEVLDSRVGVNATKAAGAGLYEELLFRLLGVTLAHAVLHDLIRVEKRTAMALSVIVTAIFFALYHDNSWESPAPVGYAYTVYYTILGCCFGGIFAIRGFGIAVAVHTLTDFAIFSLAD